MTINSPSYKNEDHNMMASAKTAAADAATNKDLALNIPEEVKAVLRPYVHPIVGGFFGLVQAGVDAGLAKLPIVGAFAATLVNPIIQKLEPVVESKFTQLLA